MGGGLARATPRRNYSTNSDWPKDFSFATAVTIAEKGPADSALNATRMKISHPHAEFVLPTSAAYSATTTSATSPCQSPSQEQALRDKPSEVVNKAIRLLAQSDPEWFAEESADFWPTLQRTNHHGA